MLQNIWRIELARQMALEYQIKAKQLAPLLNDPEAWKAYFEMSQEAWERLLHEFQQSISQSEEKWNQRANFDEK